MQGYPTKAIIFVPGGPCLSGTYWDAFLQEHSWNAKRHVIFNHEDDYLEGRKATLQDAIQKLRDEVEASPAKVTLVGHSFGAYLSLFVATMIPEKIEKVVLIGMPPSAARPQKFTEFVSSVIMGVGSNEDYTRYFRAIAPIYYKHYDETWFDSFYQKSYFKGNERMKPSEEELTNLIEKAKSIQDKLWHINGDEDNLLIDPKDVINPEHLKIIQDCGHFPMQEKSDFLNQNLQIILATNHL